MNSSPAQYNNSINLLPKKEPVTDKVSRFAKGVLVFALVIESFLLGNTLYFKLGVDLGTISFHNNYELPTVAGAQDSKFVVPVVSGLLTDEVGPNIASYGVFEGDPYISLEDNSSGLLSMYTDEVHEGSSSVLVTSEDSETPLYVISTKDSIAKLSPNKKYKVSTDYKVIGSSSADLEVVVRVLDAEGGVVKSTSAYYPTDSGEWREAALSVNTGGYGTGLIVEYSLLGDAQLLFDNLSVQEVLKEIVNIQK